MADAPTTNESSGFECAICLGECSSPVSAPCGHNYCQACLRVWVATARGHAPPRVPRCPLCNATIDVELQVNRVLESALHSLQALRLLRPGAGSASAARYTDDAAVAPSAPPATSGARTGGGAVAAGAGTSKGVAVVPKMDIKRKAEQARRTAAEAAEAAQAAADAEETTRRRDAKLKKARNSNFAFTNFPGIRTPDDFVRGLLFGKAAAKQAQLQWQSSVIPYSMLVLGGNKELAKKAIKIHRSILGYTGDKSMSFPATLAQDILTKGMEHPALMDEIYVQLCKQLTRNPGAASLTRTWHLLCMCAGTFPPSRDYENYLLNFILERPPAEDGVINLYSDYALHRLESIIRSGPSGFVPTVDEIQAYSLRPPILVAIELVDGTPLAEVRVE